MYEFLRYRIGAIALGAGIGLFLGYLKILRRYLKWRITPEVRLKLLKGLERCLSHLKTSNCWLSCSRGLALIKSKLGLRITV